MFLEDQGMEGREGPRLPPPGGEARAAGRGVSWAAVEAGMAGTQWGAGWGSQVPAHRVTGHESMLTKREAWEPLVKGMPPGLHF